VSGVTTTHSPRSAAPGPSPSAGATRQPGPGTRGSRSPNTTADFHGGARRLDRDICAAGPGFRGISSTRWSAREHHYLLLDDHVVPWSPPRLLVVALGRFGDLYGRVRIYQPGLRRLHAPRSRSPRAAVRLPGGRLGLIVFLGVQAVGGAMLMATRRRSSPTPSRPTSAAIRSASTKSPPTRASSPRPGGGRRCWSRRPGAPCSVQRPYRPRRTILS